jgi:hypothetical protein
LIKFDWGYEELIFRLFQGVFVVDQENIILFGGIPPKDEKITNNPDKMKNPQSRMANNNAHRVEIKGKNVKVFPNRISTVPDYSIFTAV